MIKDFPKQKNFKEIKNDQFSFFNILKLPHTVISNSEKSTHPTVQCSGDHWPKHYKEGWIKMQSVCTSDPPWGLTFG